MICTPSRPTPAKKKKKKHIPECLRRPRLAQSPQQSPVFERRVFWGLPPFCKASLKLLGLLTGPKPKGIKVETFRIDYLIRTPKVKKLSLQPIRLECFRMLGFLCALRLKGLLRFAAQVGSCNHQMGVSEN